jgi:hypothetical protein
MILTWTCDLCGYNNDNNNACRHCGGQTEEQLVKGKLRTVIIRKPAAALHGYYNPNVIEATQ